MKRILFVILSVTVSILVGLSGHGSKAVRALPPPEDIPEEILRTEIILAARSPIDGQIITPADYAEWHAPLHTRPPPR
ncbi:MAG: hypothetical protein ACK51W_10705 [Aphanizomenon sp.]